jgi:hypothetical protein
MFWPIRLTLFVEGSTKRGTKFWLSAFAVSQLLSVASCGGGTSSYFRIPFDPKWSLHRVRERAARA